MMLSIRVLPEAEAQARELIEWWTANRPAARDVVKDELRRVFAVLVESPNIGSPYTKTQVPAVRRCPLRKTPYHVYYRVNETTAEVIIMSVWSGMRGRGPPLR